MSIYSIVDMIAIGQSEGPVGAAAMAVLLVPFGIYSVVAVLCGIGGSVRMANARGRGDMTAGNQYFTAALGLVTVSTLAFWALLFFCRRPVLTAFGASDSATLAKTLEYADWLLGFMPVFVYSQFLGAFIRNDGAPNLVFASVIAGGIVNMFGDWYLVFPLGMGMRGAAIATVAGSCVQAGLLLTYFFSRRCRLRLQSVPDPLKACTRILGAGLGAGILALGNVVLVIMVNNQITVWGTTTELAVYGVISSVSALFQAMFGGVAEAVQPLISANLGGARYGRVRTFWRLGFTTTLLFAAVFVLVSELQPVPLIRLFVNATPEVLAAAPAIVRLYSAAYLFLGINVLAIYFLQSALLNRQAMIVALLRSIAAAGAFVYLLPLFFGIAGVWASIPASEALTCVFAAVFVHNALKKLKAQPAQS